MIEVLLADDHKILRHGLQTLLSKQLDIKVVGEADDGREAVRLAAELEPDVVVMDVGMSGLNGIEATRQITERCSTVKVLALSMHSESRFVAEMLKAGASGYLHKDCAVEELTKALREVASGRTFLGSAVADTVVLDYIRRLSSAEKGLAREDGALTHREREVLQLMAEGESTKSIAVKLQLSGKTVETHRRQIMRKLGIFTVAGLTKYAIREGLTTAE